jgi:PAS domain S-box-containing protein
MTRLRSVFVRWIPGSPHGRMRLLFLVLAVASAAAMLPPMLTSDRPLAVRVAAALVACALSAYWIHGFRRRSFSLAGEPLEAAAVFVLLAATPGDPFLPLFGIIFRGLYGGVPLAVARSAMWITALLAAHVPRGADAVHADIARSMGLALAPLLVPPLRSALERLAASERRLRSLVQNSTDVVTVVAKDLRVRYQADSIQPVLGHDADAIVGTPLLDLVHPDDREELAEFFREARSEPDCVRHLLLRLRHGRGVWRDFEVVAANRLHDPSIEGFVLNMRDITERLQVERLGERLEAQRVRQDL